MGKVVPIRPHEVLARASPAPAREPLAEVEELERNQATAMRQTVKPKGRARPQLSGQLASLWGSLESRGIVKSPPYNPSHLAKLPEFSTILPQCARALKVGVHGFGYDFESAVDAEEAATNKVLQEAMAEERKRGQRFFKLASLKVSFTTLRFCVAMDQTIIGWSGLEVLRDLRTLRASGLEHVPALTLRIGFSDPEPVLVMRKVLSQDGMRFEVRPCWERLRRYVQIHEGRMAFFKELGDPRFIDRRNGQVLKPAMTVEDHRDPTAARELLWISDYNPADPNGYGLPPWIGASIMVGGERKADEVNWGYFDNKSVPPLAALVSGGALTKESHDRIAENIETLKGVENWHKILVLEAEGPTGATAADMMHMGSNITPKVDLKPLTEAQHGDALFQKYKKTARDNVRSACGIPPILIGESEDYTRATAMTAMQVAEQFMFGPLRNEWDDTINRLLLPELELKYWWYRSGTPDLTNVEDVARAIEVGNQVGVGNPNVYSQVLERVLGVELPPNDAPWAQFPVDLVKIALQSGLVTLDFSDGGMTAQVNEEAREAFKETVGQVLEGAIERVLLRARGMAG